MIYAFIAVLLWDLVFSMLDAHHSANGIKRGLFVEGNSMITYFFGSRPSLVDLILFNCTQTAILCVFAVIAPWTTKPDVFLCLSASALGGECVRHIQAYTKARKFGA